MLFSTSLGLVNRSKQRTDPRERKWIDWFEHRVEQQMQDVYGLRISPFQSFMYIIGEELINGSDRKRNSMKTHIVFIYF